MRCGADSAHHGGVPAYRTGPVQARALPGLTTAGPKRRLAHWVRHPRRCDPAHRGKVGRSSHRSSPVLTLLLGLDDVHADGVGTRPLACRTQAPHLSDGSSPHVEQHGLLDRIQVNDPQRARVASHGLNQVPDYALEEPKAHGAANALRPPKPRGTEDRGGALETRRPGALPAKTADRRAGVRQHQVHPPCRPLPAPRLSRLPGGVAADRSNPQPLEALAGGTRGYLNRSGPAAGCLSAGAPVRTGRTLSIRDPSTPPRPTRSRGEALRNSLRGAGTGPLIAFR